MTQSAPQNTQHGFPKSRHLLRHADFERVYKKGRRHFAAHMTVFYLAREVDREVDDERAARGLQFRIGFTVRKVLGGAVVRNRMKRRLREAVRLQASQPWGVDVVINPKASLLEAGFDDVKAEVAKAFQVIQKSVSQESSHRRAQ